MYALFSAFIKEGNECGNELNKVLNENVKYALNYIKDHFKGVDYSYPKGKYILFLDCTEWGKEYNKTIKELEKFD